MFYKLMHESPLFSIRGNIGVQCFTGLATFSAKLVNKNGRKNGGGAGRENGGGGSGKRVKRLQRLIF